jgi:hypothetical protein
MSVWYINVKVCFKFHEKREEAYKRDALWTAQAEIVLLSE